MIVLSCVFYLIMVFGCCEVEDKFLLNFDVAGFISVPGLQACGQTVSK
jgi:hypothetical protein